MCKNFRASASGSWSAPHSNFARFLLHINRHNIKAAWQRSKNATGLIYFGSLCDRQLKWRAESDERVGISSFNKSMAIFASRERINVILIDISNGHLIFVIPTKELHLMCALHCNRPTLPGISEMRQQPTTKCRPAQFERSHCVKWI